ncbi:S-adenosyl-L-methionine-dependent methyltransferase [Amylocarpus encephaloides]|uniref:tRNA (adenine(58)-N(1))-methyltransferase catalytic subunit TRM61 n=1 Tax=Amylocarpus encephaloides TaxID=45428 RepID=A0A9P7YSR3_9HELO|nr:S-adenosyl-L-methionine-dependent methyltransferase [Amylocarpus encephaloides]
MIQVLSERLTPSGRVSLHKDFVDHKLIIGRGLRQTVRSQRGRDFYIHEPSLAEYTNLTPRLVTPIYSQDAHATIALLDLHPTVPGTEDGTNTGKIEIFEAGTGHGALTLNLSRAIHAANTAPPPRSSTQIEDDAPKKNPGDKSMEDSQTAEAPTDEAYEAWKRSRRAVIHSLDQSHQHSQHARRIIKEYRGGMYHDNIDFHIGSIEKYISGRLLKNGGTPFLDHAILDLPDCDKYLQIISTALKPHGSLLVFCPNITQITACSLRTKRERHPLFLDTVLELGTGVGGREWDVRPVRPRAFLRARDAEAQRIAVLKKKASLDDRPPLEEPTKVEPVRGTETDKDGWEMVCRPKVGKRIHGGGFLAQFRWTEPQPRIHGEKKATRQETTDVGED